MRFIHFSDLHASRDRKKYCLEALDKIIEKVKEEKIPYVLFSGDFWDSTITNTEASGFCEYIDAVKKLSDITKLIIIAGTPFHEPEGSVEVFKTAGATVITRTQLLSFDDIDILCIPEPRKSTFFSGTVEETNARINQHLEETFRTYKKRNKPFVVMFHGEIIGAKLQNGVEISSLISKTAISPSLMKECNADYYACGHIHEPSEVFKNCHYAGSCYPINFGEEHDAGYELVTINNETTVKRVSFGFPRNKTIEIPYSNFDSLLKKDFTNKNIKLILTVDKVDKKSLNVDSLIKKLKDNTNANNVKINFTYKEIVNYRGKEVSEQRTAVDKFKAYAELNNMEITDSLVSKLQDIQDAMVSEKFSPCDSFELEYLSLRGAIGLKERSNKDEIEIDFTKFKNGVVALTGSNGAGKTTIIENCHPFPQMLTRVGNLKEHFFLKDSHRILIYKTGSGERIKISILIDGKAKSVPTRYFVEVEKNGVWTPYKSCDGNLSSYEDFLNSSFGSVEIFLRTSFYAKEQIKNIPDLSRASKSEKMALFSALSGTEWLREVSDRAKANAKIYEEQVFDCRKQLDFLEDALNEVNEHREEIALIEEEIEKVKSFIKEDERTLEVYEKEQAVHLQARARLEAIFSQIAENKEKKENLIQSIESAKNEIDSISNNEYTNLEQRIQVYNDTEKEINLNSAKIEKIRKGLEPITNETQEIEKEIDKLLVEKEETLSKLCSAQAFISQCVSRDFSGNCPVCNSELSAERRAELQKEEQEIMAKKAEKEEEAKRLDAYYEELSLSLKDLRTEKEQLTVSLNTSLKKIEELTQENDAIKRSMEDKSIKPLLDSLNICKERIMALANQKARDELELIKTRDAIATLESSIASVPPDRTEDIETRKRWLKSNNENITDLRVRLETRKSLLEKLSDTENKAKELQSMITEKSLHLSDYEILQRAFSNNGIQVLELDSAAPEIASIANEILRESYGDRMTVSFETQRSGSGKKLIDDFIITVFDSDSNREKKLDVLSSGEAVWIKQALYFAFSVIRTRRTGFSFKTRFLDEADGSLDAESRTMYLRMIESAHKACGATTTVLITHSVEIKDIVEQKINF